MNATIPRYTVYEASGFTHLARQPRHDGVALVRTDVTSIVYNSVSLDHNNEEVTDGTLTVADVISDTLVTDDDRWKVDVTGYNWAWLVPVAAYPSGGNVYQVNVVLTMASGPPIAIPFQVQTLEIHNL